MSISEKLKQIQLHLEAPKDLYNSFGKYKYRSLEGITKAVKPLLDSNNCTLVLSDRMVEVGGRVYVEAKATLTCCESGDSVEVVSSAREAENKKGMDDAQITGAASSYARKYACNGLFAIDDTKDPDSTNEHGKGQTKEQKEKFETAENYNQLAIEMQKNTNKDRLDKWCAANKPAVDKLSKTDQGRLNSVYTMMLDMFKDKESEGNK
jgi:hypothetical protein